MNRGTRSILAVIFGLAAVSAVLFLFFQEQSSPSGVSGAGPLGSTETSVAEAPESEVLAEPAPSDATFASR